MLSKQSAIDSLLGGKWTLADSQQHPLGSVERETGLEPATTCLEGYLETSYQSLARPTACLLSWELLYRPWGLESTIQATEFTCSRIT